MKGENEAGERIRHEKPSSSCHTSAGGKTVSSRPGAGSGGSTGIRACYRWGVRRQPSQSARLQRIRVTWPNRKQTAWFPPGQSTGVYSDSQVGSIKSGRHADHFDPSLQSTPVRHRHHRACQFAHALVAGWCPRHASSGDDPFRLSLRYRGRATPHRHRPGGARHQKGRVPPGGNPSPYSAAVLLPRPLGGADVIKSGLIGGGSGRTGLQWKRVAERICCVRSLRRTR